MRATHPLNVGYLVVGLIFLGVSGSWLLHQTGVIGIADARWVLPLTLVAAGVVGLVAFAAGRLTDRIDTADNMTDTTDIERVWENDDE
ncbi:MAG TPA: hypothetical protein VFJ19_18575 [Nocardioidaceae bacterium]|nr:hypothetical protein [Nocardioidaceae bacterium]